MLITYKAYGQQEVLVRFFERIRKYIDCINQCKYFIYEQDDFEEDNSTENDDGRIYAVSFSTRGETTTKKLAEEASEDVAIMYSFTIPTCAYLITAYKPIGETKYHNLKENHLPFENYRCVSIDSEDFFRENYVLHSLNDYEDLESYEDRNY